MTAARARIRRAPLIVPCLLLACPVPGAAAEPLEEVVVTASLRRVAALELPASVTVLDGSTLRQAGLQHLQDVLPLVPNLNWASGTSRPRYFQLRGIGETDQWQGAPNPSVGFLIDGMDFSGVGMPATLIDLAQVEVLRGPQGTTYGANALAGLISVETRRPEAAPSARLEATLGDRDTGSVGAVAGGGIGDTDAAWRLAAQRFRGDGFRRNAALGRDDTNGYDETTLRGRLSLVAGDALDVDLAALWVDLDNGFDAFALDNSRVTRSDDPGRDAQRSRGLSATVAWRGPSAFELRSVTAVTDSDIVYAFDGDWGADADYDFTSRFLRSHRTASQDLRLVSTETAGEPGGWSWVGGAYALRVDESNDQLDLYGGEVYRALVSDYRADSLALYGQLEYRPAARWRVAAGLRAERRSARYRDTDGSDFAPREDMLGGNLSLEFQPHAGRSAYLTLSRGYKGGGFNIGAAVPEARRQYDAELLTSLELGWKLRGAGGRLGLDLAAFYMRRSAQQVSTSVQVDPGDPLSFIYLTDNAARGENHGLEATLRWQAGPRLSLGATLGLLETRYLDYVVGGRDLAGRGQAHAPPYQASLTAEFRDPRGWFARADLQAVAGFYFSDSHDQRSLPYELLNLRAGYETARWGASLWVRNALDADYAQRGFFFGNEPPDFPERLYVQLADGRQAGLSAWMALR
jgi:outer membrane receptor protein involved in Fe transport